MLELELRRLELGDLDAIERIERASYPTPWSRSTDSSNWMMTWVTLSRFTERRILIPLMVLRVSSMGSATLDSIEPGSAPG